MADCSTNSTSSTAGYRPTRLSADPEAGPDPDFDPVLQRQNAAWFGSWSWQGAFVVGCSWNRWPDLILKYSIGRTGEAVR